MKNTKDLPDRPSEYNDRERLLIETVVGFLPYLNECELERLLGYAQGVAEFKKQTA